MNPFFELGVPLVLVLGALIVFYLIRRSGERSAEQVEADKKFEATKHPSLESSHP